MPAKFTAVALAGGALEADFRAAGYDVVNKAYLPICGSTMLERVLKALYASGWVARIRCVTPPAAFRAAFGDARAMGVEIVEPGAGIIDSVLAGMVGLAPDELVLLCATDIPLATPAAIDAFAAKVAEANADVDYGFVSRASHEQKYPQIRHTWVRLREGTFCGGGISAVRTSAAPAVADAFRKLVAARKSPIKLASLISPWLIVRLMLGTVSVAEIERRGAEILGVSVRGIASDDPELAVNVDCLGDLRAVEKLVKAAPGG